MYLHSYDFVAFASPCSLKIVCANKHTSDEAASAIFTEAKRLESKYSYFLPSSVIGNINKRSQNTVMLDDESVQILQKTISICKSTDFVFDIALAGTLKHTNSVESKPFASLKHVQLSADGLVFSNPFTKIDLGGVIKEYSLDVSKNILNSFDISCALIDFGGDICAIGTKNGTPWKIGIKNPLNPQLDLQVLELQDICITTSGHYERDGHIIKQKNSSKYIQASCLGQNAMEAGIFSTAFLADGGVTLPSMMSAILINDQLQIDTLVFRDVIAK